MNKHTELIETIKQLPNSSFKKTFYVRGGLEYQVELSNSDLKDLATDYERLVKAAGDLVESFDQRRPDWWPNRFVALKKALEGE